MMRTLELFAAWVALLAAAAAVPAMAKPKPAIEASVPDQPWYPAGYRDFRIAGAEVVRMFPRDTWIWEDDSVDPVDRTYDLIDCSLGYDLPEPPDWRTGQYENLALDIARMRGEMRKLGYRLEVYDQPLLAYEKSELERLAIAREPPKVAPFDENAPYEDAASELEAETLPSDVAEPAEDEAVYGMDWTSLKSLAEAMDATRARLQPEKPRIVSDGGCGGAEEEFTISMSPATGRLWLINAFAFKVCERKVPDPWDHGACSWTEYSTGDSAVASGRYMYEARWPGGVVRRGAKVFIPDFDKEEQSVTFRRN